MNLVLEDVVVPRHPVRDHRERCAVLSQVPRHERVQSERAGSVTRAIFFRQLRQIEQVRARHQPLHFLEGRVLRGGVGALPLVLVFLREVTAQRA